MNHPSPAIIAQSAVRRLPRLALLLFCVAYVLPGFVGRGPWKNADITTFGVMQQMAASGQWMSPDLMGLTRFDSLLPYWLGAAAIQWLPWFDPALAARLPFVLLLALTLLTVWYSVYYLARSPQAQPVAFAFGGEASPVDYARAIADAGVLALIACLGLAQLSHETTPAVAQLGFMALLFFSVAASPYRSPWRLWSPGTAFVVGMTGLALSGAPAVAFLLGAGSVVVAWAHGRWGGDNQPAHHRDPELTSPQESGRWMLVMLITTLGVALLSYFLGLWAWRIDVQALSHAKAQKEWGSTLRLLLWFPWPAWPLALWTLFRWRRQLASRHVALPLWFAVVTIGTTLLTSASDRGLLLSLPPLATLAAFSLPTLRRSVASLIDWFTLLFFTSCGIIIWVIWIAMQTGVPRQPAANVAKLAPGFEPSFSALTFGLAVLATLAWAWLVKWRAGQQRAAVWKSLILPAGGTTLCWLLLMTLWLPLLDYARSYAPMSQQVARRVNPQACVEVLGLNTAQTAAFRYHNQLDLRRAGKAGTCPYLVVDTDSLASMGRVVNPGDWALVSTVRRPTDRTENVAVYRRISQITPPQRPPPDASGTAAAATPLEPAAGALEPSGPAASSRP